MKKIILLTNVPCIVFAVCACIMAINDISGWGWFLLCSVLSITTNTVTKTIKDAKKTENIN